MDKFCSPRSWSATSMLLFRLPPGCKRNYPCRACSESLTKKACERLLRGLASKAQPARKLTSINGVNNVIRKRRRTNDYYIRSTQKSVWLLQAGVATSYCMETEHSTTLLRNVSSACKLKCLTKGRRAFGHIN